MRPLNTLRNALRDPDAFAGQCSGPSWQCWRIVLLAALGEALTDDEREIFTRLTGGRRREPAERGVAAAKAARWRS
jgi:hypothetical protein